MSLYLTEKGLSYVLQHACDSLTAESDRVDMTLEGACITAENIVAGDKLAFDRQYYLPGCAAGIKGIHSYTRLCIKNVYPGIDWILYSEPGGRFKYDFMVHPGADPRQIQLLYACDGTVSSDGHSLGICTASGNIEDGVLKSFQGLKIISSRYALEPLESTDRISRCRVKIDVQAYNPQQPLTIDPAVTWATNLDGAGIVRDVDYDAQGNVFLLGLESPATNMPILNTGSGYHQSMPASNDIVIYKFDPNGALIWCTNFGGSGDEAPGILAVSPTGTLYVTGRTESNDLPVMNSGGFYQGTLNATGPFQTDAFILKFDAGCNLLWSTYIGAPAAVEDFTSACFDLSGNIILAGIVSGQQMPLLNGGGYFDNTYNGGNYDGYIARFSPSDVLLHGTFLGSPGADFDTHGCLRIISDPQGNVWMCGNVRSPGLPYASNGGYFSTTLNGSSDAVFGKFDPAFNLVWLTNFGGSSHESCSDLTIDRCGNVWITGFTLSSDLPTVNAGGYMHTMAAGDSLEGFIVKLNSACQLTWATALGGNKADWFNAVVTDGMNVWALGFSNSTNLPAVPMGSGLNQSSNGGGEDAMIYCFNQSTALVYASYFGNAAPEELQAAALDSVHDRLYFVGQTPGSTQPFYMKTQATPASYQSTGNDEGFIVQLSVNKAVMPFSYTVHDTTLCTNDPLVLHASHAPPGTYLWDSGATSYSLSVNNSGTYWVRESGNCQLFADTFHIMLNPVPVLAVPGDTTLEEGNSLAIHATSTMGAQYTWLPADDLSCSNCLDPVAAPGQSISYCLRAITAAGCGDTACFTIHVIEKPCPGLADNSLPEAFTPNGDNNNDVYVVNGWGFCIREFNFKVFDRWGEKLFETSDPHINWDGRYMNKDLETGVYVYQLTAVTRHDEKLNRKGTITLSR